MVKKIAVIVRNRQAEALRMAIGLALEDDELHVYIMDCELDGNDPAIAANLAMLNEIGACIVSNCPESSFATKNNETIARELVHYDSVIPY